MTKHHVMALWTPHLERSNGSAVINMQLHAPVGTQSLIRTSGTGESTSRRLSLESRNTLQ